MDLSANRHNNKIIGAFGEDAVRKLYEKNNFKIIARNFYNHRGRSFGEIDLVALKNNYIHFVEIKVRGSDRFGQAAESITTAKQRRIIKAAQFFLLSFRQFENLQPRFDLVSVDLAFDKTVERITIHSDIIEDVS